MAGKHIAFEMHFSLKRKIFHCCWWFSCTRNSVVFRPTIEIPDGAKKPPRNPVIQLVTERSLIPDRQRGHDSPTHCLKGQEKRHHPKRVTIADFAGSYSLIIRNTTKLTTGIPWRSKNTNCIQHLLPPEGLPKNHHFCRGGFGLVQGGQPKIDTTVLCKKRGRSWGGTIGICVELYLRWGGTKSWYYQFKNLSLDLLWKSWYAWKQMESFYVPAQCNQMHGFAWFLKIWDRKGLDIQLDLKTPGFESHVDYSDVFYAAPLYCQEILFRHLKISWNILNWHFY